MPLTQPPSIVAVVTVLLCVSRAHGQCLPGQYRASSDAPCQACSEVFPV